MARNHRPHEIHPIVLRELEVRRISDVSPAMRRVTLTGEQLGPFVSDGIDIPVFHSTGFDDHIKLFFAYPGDDEVTLPVQRDGRLEVIRGQRPLAKSYTVRRWDPGSRELDVDFVRHETGIAATWAYRCRPGDRIHISGPGRSQQLPAGRDWYLLAADETALPALGRCLEENCGAAMQVFVEVPDESHRQELLAGTGTQITWLYRGSEKPGTRLTPAIRQSSWHPGTAFCWVAGESSAVNAVRRHLVDDREVPKEELAAVGYWRRLEVRRRADDPSLPDLDKNAVPPGVKVRLQSSLAIPMAMRTAVSLGICDAIQDGVHELNSLAEHTGTDPRALRKLLRALVSIGLLTDCSGRYELTETGAIFTHEIFETLYHVEGVNHALDLGLLGLSEAVRTGRPGPGSEAADKHRNRLAARLENPAFAQSWIDRAQEKARLVAPALARAPEVKAAHRLLLIGDGAAEAAREMVSSHDTVVVSIAARVELLPVLQQHLAATVKDPGSTQRIRVLSDPWEDDPCAGETATHSAAIQGMPTQDCVVLLFTTGQQTDDQVTHTLRQVSSSVAPEADILVVENPFDEHDPYGVEAEQDLRLFALYGSGHRTDQELRELFTAAHARVHQTRSLGANGTLYRLETSVHRTCWPHCGGT